MESYFSLHDPFIFFEFFSHVHVFSPPLHTRTQGGKRGKCTSRVQNQSFLLSLGDPGHHPQYLLTYYHLLGTGFVLITHLLFLGIHRVTLGKALAAPSVPELVQRVVTAVGLQSVTLGLWAALAPLCAALVLCRLSVCGRVGVVMKGGGREGQNSPTEFRLHWAAFFLCRSVMVAKLA